MNRPLPNELQYAAAHRSEGSCIDTNSRYEHTLTLSLLHANNLKPLDLERHTAASLKIMHAGWMGSAVLVNSSHKRLKNNIREEGTSRRIIHRALQSAYECKLCAGVLARKN